MSMHTHTHFCYAQYCGDANRSHPRTSLGWHCSEGLAGSDTAARNAPADP